MSGIGENNGWGSSMNNWGSSMDLWGTLSQSSQEQPSPSGAQVEEIDATSGTTANFGFLNPAQTQPLVPFPAPAMPSGFGNEPAASPLAPVMPSPSNSSPGSMTNPTMNPTQTLAFTQSSMRGSAAMSPQLMTGEMRVYGKQKMSAWIEDDKKLMTEVDTIIMQSYQKGAVFEDKILEIVQNAMDECHAFISEYSAYAASLARDAASGKVIEFSPAQLAMFSNLSQMAATMPTASITTAKGLIEVVNLSIETGLKRDETKAVTNLFTARMQEIQVFAGRLKAVQSMDEHEMRMLKEQFDLVLRDEQQAFDHLLKIAQENRATVKDNREHDMQVKDFFLKTGKEIVEFEMKRNQQLHDNRLAADAQAFGQSTALKDQDHKFTMEEREADRQDEDQRARLAFTKQKQDHDQKMDAKKLDVQAKLATTAQANEFQLAFQQTQNAFQAQQQAIQNQFKLGSQKIKADEATAQLGIRENARVKSEGQKLQAEVERKRIAANERTSWVKSITGIFKIF